VFRRLPFLLPAAALLLLLGACSRLPAPPKIGEPAPLFTIVDSDRRVSLEELRGRIVVLNFWATWCPPCVDEMPSLVELQRRMADQVTVLAISIDRDKAAYERFLRDYNIEALTVIRDADQGSNSLYGSFRLPETFIIDREGLVRRKFIGPADWVKPEITEYLAALHAEGEGQSAATTAPAAGAARSQ
jgi:cytochrome c biogenesis protein CcmG/thiol:disulfide interchange protein DsbE